VGIDLTINVLLKGDEMNYLYDRMKDRLRRSTA